MLKINPDFENLIPPLSEDEFNGLEKSILEEGVREPIVTWRGYIVDGHNRYKIATKYGLDFDTVEYDFADEAAVKLWMIRNQLSRRNLEKSQIAMLAVLEDDLVEPLRKAAHEREYSGKANPDATPHQGRNPQTNDVIARSIGVGSRIVADAMKVRKSGDEQLVADVLSGKISVNKAAEQVKRAERQTAIDEAKAQPRSASYVDIFNTDKKYRVIYADPPWSYNDECKTGGVQSRGASGVYTVMTLEDICKLPVPSQDNAVLFMWTTSPMLEVSFDVINSWGFTYKSSFIWDKVAHNRGHYNSVRHEFLLIAVKGSCTPDVKKLYDSVVSIERTEHSRKPAYFRELIDELYPIGERIELFAREAADGWDVWGDMA